MSGADGGSSLQIAYENAKARGAELASMSKTAPNHLRAQLMLAAKTYHAVSTVIFSSICIGQIADLEGFIHTSSQSLPPSLFDISEWSGPMKHAEDTRNCSAPFGAGGGAGFGGSGSNNYQGDDFAAYRAGRIGEMQKSLAMLSKDVSAEIATMNGTLTSFKTQLVPLLNKETQRYAELQQKFNEIDDNNKNAIKAIIAENDEKIAVARQNEARATEELAQLTATMNEKIDDLKYSYESEIDRMKDLIAQKDGSELKLQNMELKQAIKDNSAMLQSSKNELNNLKESTDRIKQESVS
jgi:hypothetical protein